MCINAAQLQYAGCTGTGVAISVVQGQLLQGSPLCFVQVDDALHPHSRSGNSEKNK